MGRRLKIALVNLRARRNDWHHIVMVPLGLMSLAAAARRAFGERVDIRLFDMVTLPPGKDPEDDLRRFLQDHPPDLLGIRGFTSQAAEYPVVAALAREVNPACLVVAGGPHASTGSPTLFEAPGIDLVAFGEGEETFVEIVGHRLRGDDCRSTKGLGWLAGGRPVKTPPRPPIADLDGLPFPDHSLLDLARYQGGITMTDFPPKARFTSLFTSRGCPYRCTYCHDLFGKRVRCRSVASVLAEMAHLIETHGVREFHIVDDIFNADRRRALGIFEGIVRRGWRIWLAFPNGLRGDLLDEEFVAAARAAGTYHWALAVETASWRLQKRIRKYMKLDRLLDAIALADRHGVFTATFNMLGFPTETEAEMRATIDFNVESAAHDIQLFVVTPYEGTRLHEEAAGLEPGTPPDAERLGYTEFSAVEGHASLSDAPRARLEELIVEANRRFFFQEAGRVRRAMELAPRAHGLADLAVHLGRRLYTAGLTLQSLNPAVRATLMELFRGARALAPGRSAHLPVPGPATS